MRDGISPRHLSSARSGLMITSRPVRGLPVVLPIPRFVSCGNFDCEHKTAPRAHPLYHYRFPYEVSALGSPGTGLGTLVSCSSVPVGYRWDTRGIPGLMGNPMGFRRGSRAGRQESAHSPARTTTTGWDTVSNSGSIAPSAAWIWAREQMGRQTKQSDTQISEPFVIGGIAPA
jgi:hypothetical protein